LTRRLPGYGITMARAAEHEPTIGELVSHVTEEVSSLVRDEMRLAQVEISRKMRFAGLGAGLFGAAGVVAGLGLATLVAAAVLALALVVPAWLSALVIGVVLLATAGVCAMVGKRELADAMPPLPEEALSEVKADLRLLKR